MTYIPHSFTPNHLLRLIAALPLLLLVNGCSWSFDQIQTSDKSHHEIIAGSEQIRLRMRSLVDPMCGEVEQAADRIIRGTDDPKIRKAAIEWKAQAIPALREALFQSRPLTATLDTWVLLNQMILFFDQGDGAKSMGASAPIAVNACLKMESEFNHVASELTKSGNADKARSLAREWAAKHPIRGSISHRESTLTRSLEVDINDEFNASDAIADITLSFDDLNRRLEIYSDQIPRQARWETQLLTADLARDYRFDQAIPLAENTAGSIDDIRAAADAVSVSADHVASDIDKLVPLVERLTILVETTPKIVADERAIAIRAAHDEISRTLETIAKEREIAFDRISLERLAALQSLHEIITTERQALTVDVEKICTRVVDHAFSRIIQILIGLLAAFVVILLFGLWIIRRMISGLITEMRPVSSS